MRLTKRNVRAGIVEAASSKYQLDKDTVADFAALLYGGGSGMVGRAERARRRAKLPWAERASFDKQWRLLDQTRRWTGFRHYVRMIRESSIEDALDRLLALILEANKKQHTSYCSVCPLLSNCSHGQYAVGEVSADGPVLPNCPRYLQQQAPPASGVPATQAQSVQRLALGIGFLKTLITPTFAGYMSARLPAPMGNFLNAMTQAMAAAGGSGDPGSASMLTRGGGGCGTGTGFDATFTGSDVHTRLSEVLRAITKAQLAVFQMARNIEEFLPTGKTGDKEQSNDPSTSMQVKRMDEMADVQRALPSQQALPPVLRTYRTATKQLTVRQHMKPLEKKQLFYVLLDSSGSMGSAVEKNANAFFTRGHIASALALAVVRKAWEEKSMVALRFFAGSPDRMRFAQKPSELVDLCRQIGLGDYNGMSTDIQSALLAAMNDIQNRQDVSKAEVLLISDGGSYVNETAVRAAQKTTKLHTLEIRSYKGETNQASAALKALSETHQDMDPSSVDPQQLSKLV